MAWNHLDEELRSQFAQDFERVVPTNRMRHVGREVLAYVRGVMEGATAAIAHVGDRRRPQSEPGHCLRQAIRDRLEQWAMRRDADLQMIRTARPCCRAWAITASRAALLPATTICLGALMLEM